MEYMNQHNPRKRTSNDLLFNTDPAFEQNLLYFCVNIHRKFTVIPIYDIHL